MDRKKSHLDLAQQQQVHATDFDQLRLQHCALPNFNFSEIDIRTQFLHFQLQAPIMISSMTGGTSEAEFINQHLAEAASECGIAMCVGSQRVSYESSNTDGLHKKVRKWAGSAPLFGNVGLANLIQWNDAQALNRMAEQIEADAMIIHLNPMQEVFQDNGDLDWHGSRECLAQSIDNCKVPVVVKEVGMGISPEVARICVAAGAAAIDVAGSGGTCFIGIEGAMSKQNQRIQAAKTFGHWGESTVSLLQQLQANPLPVPIIASGGIRNGLDIAKCIALGASITAIAGIILGAGRDSTNACVTLIEQLKYELAIACWGTGCKNVHALTQVGKTYLNRDATG